MPKNAARSDPPDGVHHGPDVVDPLLERGEVSEPVRETSSGLVERDDS